MSFLIGVVGPLAILILTIVATGGKISSIWEGADGRASTSKFQFFIWTLAVSLAYIAVVARRGDFSAIPEVPTHLLIAMGFSATTLAAAKGITTVYSSSGALSKPDAVPAAVNADGKTGIAFAGRTIQAKPDRKPSAAGWAGLLQDDGGFPDLSKIQLLFWTFLAIAIFIAAVWRAVQTAKPDLPDVDPSLMVLMGLGQAAYLGKKLVTTDTPRLTGLTSTRVLIDPEVTLGITGGGLGDGKDSQVNFNQQLLPCTVTNWTDSQITLTDIQPPFGLTPPVTGELTVVVGGVESDGLKLDLVPEPHLTRLSTDKVSLSGSDGTLALFGSGLGTTPSEVDFNGDPLPYSVKQWTDSQVKLVITSSNAAGPGKIRVVVDDRPSNELNLELA